MQEIHLKRTWWVFALFAVASLGFAFAGIYAITWPAVEATQLGQPLARSWSWPAVLVADVAMIIMAIALSNIPLSQLRTAFSDKGIKMPGLLRSKFIAWDDISRLEGTSSRSTLLKITGSDQSIIINKFYYQRPDELTSLLQAHAPASCRLRD